MLLRVGIDAAARADHIFSLFEPEAVRRVVCLRGIGYGAHMSRIHDLGGMQGFGTVDPSDDPEPFAADWEARVFALNSALIRSGVYTVDEFRDAIERLPPADYLAASYYERWFAAVCDLLAAKGVATPDELEPPA